MLGITDANRKWWVLIAMGAALGLMVLDETIVGVALPTMQRDLGLSATESHWVVNAYLVVFAALAAAMGKLGDMVGLKRFFILALVIFGATSLAAGFAQDETTIIAARALQGVGAAIVLPGSMAMMMTVFPPAQRGMALGVYGAVGSCFMASGPLLGGAFTEYLSWRWIFWVNPFIVVAIGLVVLAAWRDPPRQVRGGRFDLGGFVTLVAGVGLLVMGLMQGPDWGWTSSAVMALIALGAVSLVVFVIVELRHPAPLIEVDLFANRTLAAANLIIFTGQFAKTSVFVLVALYLQQVLGMSALGAGLALLWSVLPIPVMAIYTGQITDRLGERRPALYGFAIGTAAFVWIAIFANGSGYWILAPGLLAFGIANCFFFVPPMRAVANALPDEKQGQAGGIMLTSQLLGGTMGMTILGIVLIMTLDYHVVFALTVAVNLVVGSLTWAWFVRDGRQTGEQT
jgi:EmrB/QacA subfamily drug resistance transporter